MTLLAFLSTGLSLAQNPPTIGLLSNEISYLAVQGSIIWAGTGAGLSRSVGGGDTADDWFSFGPDQGLLGHSVSSLFVSGDTILAAAVDETGEYGQGLNLSTDSGESWTAIDSDTSFIGRGRVAWGVTLSGPHIWAAIWNGLAELGHSLAHSPDGGLTWEYLRPSNDFNKPLAFAVSLDESHLWCGTGTGVHRTSDNGGSWQQFNTASGDLPGDWVVRFRRQQVTEGAMALWACCRRLGEDQHNGLARYSYAASTWEIADSTHQVWDLAFDRETIWAAAEEGLLRSTDDGANWEVFGKAEGLASDKAYAVAVVGDTVWAGSDDGLSRSIDAGATWGVIRRSPASAVLGIPTTYAYPNPFSPLRDQLAKIRYSVPEDDRLSITIYNFAHQEVRVLVRDKMIAEGGEEVETWDGRDRSGRVVANGVYFYEVKSESGESAWGKIAVLD